VIDAMQADSGIELASLRVDGGAVANNFLMQFQADLLNTEVHRPKVVEVTALGAAYLAGIAVGFWEGLEEVSGKAEIDRTFIPSDDAEKRETRYSGWKRAVQGVLSWSEFTQAEK
jgi:glycerol kinase